MFQWHTKFYLDHLITLQKNDHKSVCFLMPLRLWMKAKVIQSGIKLKNSSSSSAFPAISLGFTIFGVCMWGGGGGRWLDFCICNHLLIQPERWSHSIFMDGACWVWFLLLAFTRQGHKFRIFQVHAMECMWTQTRPQSILFIWKNFYGME